MNDIMINVSLSNHKKRGIGKETQIEKMLNKVFNLWCQKSTLESYHYINVEKYEINKR